MTSWVGSWCPSHLPRCCRWHCSREEEVSGQTPARSPRSCRSWTRTSTGWGWGWWCRCKSLQSPPDRWLHYYEHWKCFAQNQEFFKLKALCTHYVKIRNDLLDLSAMLQYYQFPWWVESLSVLSKTWQVGLDSVDFDCHKSDEFLGWYFLFPKTAWSQTARSSHLSQN